MDSPPLQLARLTSRRQFVAAREKGKTIVTPYFVLQYVPVACVLPSPRRVAPPSLMEPDVTGESPTDACLSTAPLLIGFTVTRKLGNAVRRNRIKRRLREVARLVFPTNAREGYAYVLIGRYNAHTADFATLTRHAASALAKVQHYAAGT